MRAEKGNKLIQALPWISLITTMGITASGEYTLAVQCGFPAMLAAGYPISLDSYAISAFYSGSKADVVISLVLMMACQVLSHLVAVNLIGVTWWLVVAVACVPPLVLWRVHSLVGHGNAEKDTPEVLETPPRTTPASVPEAPVFTALPIPAHVKPLPRQAARKSKVPHTPAECGVDSTVHHGIQAVLEQHPGMSLAGIAEAVERSPRTIQRCVNGK